MQSVSIGIISKANGHITLDPLPIETAKCLCWVPNLCQELEEETEEPAVSRNSLLQGAEKKKEGGEVKEKEDKERLELLIKHPRSK